MRAAAGTRVKIPQLKRHFPDCCSVGRPLLPGHGVPASRPSTSQSGRPPAQLPPLARQNVHASSGGNVAAAAAPSYKRSRPYDTGDSATPAANWQPSSRAQTPTSVSSGLAGALDRLTTPRPRSSSALDDLLNISPGTRTVHAGGTNILWAFSSSARSPRCVTAVLWCVGCCRSSPRWWRWRWRWRWWWWWRRRRRWRLCPTHSQPPARAFPGPSRRGCAARLPQHYPAHERCVWGSSTPAVLLRVYG
jgi:hypothetical protein